MVYVLLSKVNTRPVVCGVVTNSTLAEAWLHWRTDSAYVETELGEIPVTNLDDGLTEVSKMSGCRQESL
jgi:hypothetical protein